MSIRDAKDAPAQREPVRAERWDAALSTHIDPFAVFATVRDKRGRVVDFRYLEANEAAAEYHHMRVDELVGKTLLDLYPGLRDNGWFDQYVNTATTGTPLVMDNLPYFNEVLGELRWYDLRAVICDEGVAITWHDNTSRHQSHAALAEAEELFRMMLSNVYGVVVLYVEGRVRWISPSVEATFGHTVASLTGTRMEGLWHPDDAGAVESVCERALAGLSGTEVVQARHLDGHYLWVEVAVTPFRTHIGDDAIIAAIRDITNKVNTQSALQHEIYFDDLTGLAKRPLGLQRIQAILDGNEIGWGLLCFGVAGMRSINQTHSYSGGDQVLKAVADRLVAAAGAHDRVTRIAGGEFALLLPGVHSPEDAVIAAERIFEGVAQPLALGDSTVVINGYMGIAMVDGHDAQTLVTDATAAMRQAATIGPGRWEFLDSDEAAALRGSLDVEAQLRAALAGGQIVPWFMPVASLETGQVVGYEALVRWARSDGTVTAPVEFLAVAERTGLIVAIDRAIMRQTLDVAALHPDLGFGINISGGSLSSRDLSAWIRGELDRTGVDPHKIHLEVTETALFQVTDAMRTGMTDIAYTGVDWWVDDFGTGFSSITHLRELPISGLKLDRSFTAGLTPLDGQAVRLAQGLIGLAAGLGLETIAEGVETAEQVQILSAQGWKYGQGWFYGKAAPLPNPS